MRLRVVPYVVIPLLALTACAPTVVQTVHHEREVFGAMLLPGPTAPNAVGPLAPVGQLAIDAQLSVGARETATSTREEGAPGTWVSRDAGSVHLGAGATRWLELGVSFEVRSSENAEPLAVGMPVMDTDPVLATLGTQVRVAPELAPDLRAGLLVEFDLTSSWFERSTVLTTTTELRSTEFQDYERTVETSTRTETGTALLPAGRAGAMVLWTPDPVHFGLGVSVRTFPVFDGYSRQEWDCTDGSDGSHHCDETPDVPESLVTRHRYDAWLETGVRIDRVWVLWTGWAALAGDDTGTRAGATFAIRYWPGPWT